MIANALLNLINIIKVMNFIEELLNSQTDFCEHKDGCLMSAIKQSIKNLKYGMMISLALQLIKSLKALAKSPSKVKNSLKIQYFSIAAYLVSTILAMKIVRCTLRRIREQDDGLNSLIAGAAGGWVASKTLSTQYWYFYLTFLASRIIGAFHKRLIEKGVLSKKNQHWHSYAMMAFAHGVHSYGYFLHPYILKNDMYGLYEKMSALTPNEKRWHLSALKYTARRTQQRFGSYPEFDLINQQRINRLQGIIEKEQKQMRSHTH